MRYLLFVWIYFSCSLANSTQQSLGDLGEERIGVKIIHNYALVNPVERWDYDWTTAVFLHGLINFLSAFPDAKSDLQFTSVSNFYDRVRTPDVTSPDLVSMALPAAEMLALGKVSPGLNFTLQAATDFLNTEPLNSLGALNHVGSKHRFSWWLPPTRWFSAPSIWVDSIVMYGLMGLKVSAIKKNPKLEKFSVDQFQIFEKHLREEKSGLYKHAFFIAKKELMPHSSFWGRGNGWMIWALADAIEFLPNESAARSTLKNQARDHYAAMMKVFSLDGGFRTLLTDNSSRFETSVLALTAAASAKLIRLKILECVEQPKIHAFKDLLYRNLKAQDERSISVENISGPTTAFPYSWYYKNIVGMRSDESYGVGAVLLALTEFERLKKSNVCARL